MKINKQNITIFIPVANLSAQWKGDFQKLPPNKTYTLVIDYPLSNNAQYKINTGKHGIGLVALLSKIGKFYQKTYDMDDFDGRYGIMGHDIEDLSLEGIHINHKLKRISLSIGS